MLQQLNEESSKLESIENEWVDSYAYVGHELTLGLD